MSKERLSSVAILAIDKNIAQILNLAKIIEQFANAKACRGIINR